MDDQVPPSKCVGLDPGKRNVATMIDTDGITLKYTSRQRLFESRVVRYRQVLEMEKRRAGIDALEAKLSEHSARTNNLVEFFSYLAAKKLFGESEAGKFYVQDRWRNWRLSMFSARKSSEERFINTVKTTYGKDTTIYYGNWSRKTQICGCPPAPVEGLRKKLREKFHVVITDEYMTSRTCSTCLGELTSYLRKNGTKSRSRLCCTKCGHQKGRLRHFVDRDVNAAANILVVGLSDRPPQPFRRPSKRTREEEEEEDA